MRAKRMRMRERRKRRKERHLRVLLAVSAELIERPRHCRTDQ